MLAGDLKGENDKAKVYEYYVHRQNAIYALDFDDLLLVTVRMLRQFPEIQAKWVQRFQYIHVDEFQDIDKIQYDLIRLLANQVNSVYVVGDPDQTIYTWRGADVNIIMNFEKDFQPCETIVLNENYRSTPSILNGANALIHNNRNRVEKDLFTSGRIMARLFTTAARGKNKRQPGLPARSTSCTAREVRFATARCCTARIICPGRWKKR